MFTRINKNNKQTVKYPDIPSERKPVFYRPEVPLVATLEHNFLRKSDDDIEDDRASIESYKP